MFPFSRRRAFTMAEVFAVLLLISVLVMLLLPAVQSSREMARRTSCSNNLMQVALAVHGYHAAFDRLPVQLGGTDGSPVVGADNDRRLSFLVPLLPFLGQQELAEKIGKPLDRVDWSRDQIMDPFATGFDPFAEETERYQEQLQQRRGSGQRAKQWVAGGPEPSTANYVPWLVEITATRCPSDPGIGSPAMGRSNYAACLGDGLLCGDSGPFKEVRGTFVWDQQLAEQTEAAMRGMFVPRTLVRFSDVSDGLSQTLLLGEIATGLGDDDTRTRPAPGPGPDVLRDNPNWVRQTTLINTERPRFWENPTMGKVLGSSTGFRRGYRWADGMPLYTGFNTILPPNQPIVLHSDRDDCWGVLPPSSRHQGGANVALGDASVRFVTDSIDAGDPHQATVYVGSANPPQSDSPYGLWGALGTRSSGELRTFEPSSALANEGTE